MKQFLKSQVTQNALLTILMALGTWQLTTTVSLLKTTERIEVQQKTNFETITHLTVRLDVIENRLMTDGKSMTKVP